MTDSYKLSLGFQCICRAWQVATDHLYEVVQRFMRIKSFTPTSRSRSQFPNNLVFGPPAPLQLGGMHRLRSEWGIIANFVIIASYPEGLGMTLSLGDRCGISLAQSRALHLYIGVTVVSQYPHGNGRYGALKWKWSAPS